MPFCSHVSTSLFFIFSFLSSFILLSSFFRVVPSSLVRFLISLFLCFLVYSCNGRRTPTETSTTTTTTTSMTTNTTTTTPFCCYFYCSCSCSSYYYHYLLEMSISHATCSILYFVLVKTFFLPACLPKFLPSFLPPFLSACLPTVLPSCFSAPVLLMLSLSLEKKTLSSEEKNYPYSLFDLLTISITTTKRALSR